MRTQLCITCISLNLCSKGQRYGELIKMSNNLCLMDFSKDSPSSKWFSKRTQRPLWIQAAAFGQVHGPLLGDYLLALLTQGKVQEFPGLW